MDDNWESALGGFGGEVEQKADDGFVMVTEELSRSMLTGSELTGSRGQPVGQYGPGYHPGKVGGTLLSSFVEEFTAKNEWTITTNAPHAEQEELGVGRYGPVRMRSTIGGFHSKELTEQGYENIVANVEQRLEGQG